MTNRTAIEEIEVTFHNRTTGRKARMEVRFNPSKPFPAVKEAIKGLHRYERSVDVSSETQRQAGEGSYIALDTSEWLMCFALYFALSGKKQARRRLDPMRPPQERESKSRTRKRSARELPPPEISPLDLVLDNYVWRYKQAASQGFNEKQLRALKRELGNDWIALGMRHGEEELKREFEKRWKPSSDKVWTEKGGWITPKVVDKWDSPEWAKEQEDARKKLGRSFDTNFRRRLHPRPAKSDKSSAKMIFDFHESQGGLYI